MIIGAGRTYKLSEFLEGLTMAGRAVVWVTALSVGRGGCTGWLLTDRLAVIPGFATSMHNPALQADATPGAPRFRCRIGDNTEEIEAELVHEPLGRDPSRPALLRLDRQATTVPLGFELSALEPGERLIVLHHPGGVPDLQLSLGQVLRSGRQNVYHDAATSPGSAGAPVLSADSLRVVGMHVKGTQENANEAVALAEFLDELRMSPYWYEIAGPHRLADIAAVRREERVVPPKPDTGPNTLTLLPLALRWSIDGTEIDPAQREAARAFVDDPEAPGWSLPAEERQRLIKEAGSLDRLRAARGPRTPAGPGQRVIDRILDGPPFDLVVLLDEELPYWLQVVGWFDTVVPGLPAAADVHRTLTRRRVRGRLRDTAGDRLWGRESELRRLQRWYDDEAAGPIAITGIGGVGKSALIARFALDLPQDTLLLWLDFDRADLAPDDAVSVLDALSDQLVAQVDGGIEPVRINGAQWAEAADVLGAALADAAGPPPLLVLDGFEIAQHAERYEEIWSVLDHVLARMPAMRVLVSGRSPVPGLKLVKRAAETFHLEGLTDEAALAWLRDRGVHEPAVLESVLRMAHGVPLVLKLAVRLVEMGEDIHTVPGKLPDALIQGYLYQRILHRIVGQDLQPLAHDVLQLRRLTAGMLPSVLGDRLPPGDDTATVFARLSRELAIVDTSEDGPTLSGAAQQAASLRLRPEVRSATLRLLELHDADRVREIDRRAAAWYATQDSTDVQVAAELVYHRLRLGDVAGAAEAWQDVCAPLLRTADEDIPEDLAPAREWLRNRVGRSEGTGLPLAVWEQEAYGRVRDLLSRGLTRAVAPVLRERAGRRDGSPLIAYDAWVRWRLDGDLVDARRLLAEAGPGAGPVGRERSVLGALLAAADHDPHEADQLLAPLDAYQAWKDRTDGATEALAVRAARIRLTVNVPAELEVAGLLAADPTEGKTASRRLRQVLEPGDVLLPSLSRRLQGRNAEEKLDYPMLIPTGAHELDRFREMLMSSIEADRDPALPAHWPDQPRTDPQTAWTPRDWGIDLQAVADAAPSGDAHPADLVGVLVAGAVRRWWFATRTLFLRDAFDALGEAKLIDALRLGIVGTLAAFRNQALWFPDRSSVDDLIEQTVSRLSSSAVAPADAAPEAAAALLLEQEELRLTAMPVDSAGLTALPQEGWHTGFNVLAVYLLGPDPLDVLHRRVLNIPEADR